MILHTHTILIILSSIVILSYFFNLISKKTNVPSVLLLIGTGIGMKYALAYYGFPSQDVGKLVKILGAIGLIMIILEAALDLKLSRDRVKLIRNSFFSALFIFIISVLGIGFLITYSLDVPFERGFLYAIPLSIISSAIVIPSTSHLPMLKKEFIIYESSFSDIIGIMLFNYMLMKNVMSFGSAMTFFGNVGLAVLISALASFILLFILTKSRIDLKFFLAFAILALVYSLGEMIHLPALLIVLVFGMVLNNTKLLMKGKIKEVINMENIDGILVLMKSITAETSFLIRTFFFIVFGYSFDLMILANSEVLVLGSLIVGILLLVRFVYLRLILKTNLFPELFLMPRGLVTILLFYSIPAEKSLGNFNTGVLFFVVVVTSLLMAFGLMFFKKDREEYLEGSEEAI